ncbi:MAG: hypothetical protein ACRCVN_01130 [Spirochaetia bacterium]
MFIIILGALISGSIGVFAYGFMKWDNKSFFDGIVAFFAVFSFINPSLSMPILLCVDRVQIWAPPVESKTIKTICFIYSFAVIFFILSNTALAILYKDNWQTFLRVFLFLGGGATLPILIYCARSSGHHGQMCTLSFIDISQCVCETPQKVDSLIDIDYPALIQNLDK